MLKTNKTLSFLPSRSKDVVEHRIRIVPHGEGFSYSTAYASIVAKLEFPLPQMEVGSTLYVTAVDNVGNESDYLSLEINNMAYLKSKTLRFKPSASPDVAEHRVRILKDGTAFGYNQPFASIPANTPQEGGKFSVDIAKLTNAPKSEGVYDVFVTAVDKAGNESDPLEISNASFDFNPPEAPTEGEVV